MIWSLPVNANIAGTLRAWRSEIVSGLILSHNDFRMRDFDPATDFNTMAATSYKVNRARGITIGSLFHFSIDIQATLAATFSSAVLITLPVIAAGDTSSMQGVAGFGQNAGTGEACVALIVGGNSTLPIYRYSNANYTAGAWRARINGFIEIDS